jgi:hypothetical protein
LRHDDAVELLRYFVAIVWSEPNGTWNFEKSCNRRRWFTARTGCDKIKWRRVWLDWDRANLRIVIRRIVAIDDYVWGTRTPPMQTACSELR